MKAQLRAVHRWLSLAVAAVWLVQALSGAFLVFHWEFDDWTIAAAHRPTDSQALGQRIEALEAERPGLRVTSMWTSAGAPDRYDITVEDVATGSAESVRVDGAGNILRRGDAGLISTIVMLHHELLAGNVGSWIVGLSGILLLTNIVLGLKLAWPAAGQWRHTLLPSRMRGTVPTLYGWHRAAGLWLALPAAVSVLCGTLLVFEGGVSRLVGAPSYAPTLVEAATPTAAKVAPGQAIETALARYPGSTIAGVAMPSAEEPWYRIRVRQPDELRRAYGVTTLFVSASSGRIIGDFSAFEAPLARKFMDLLFPFHTGEAGGTAGRFFVVAIGLWLATMVALGIGLWWTRRWRKKL